MSYQRDREQFIVQVTREGLPYWVAERLLREATGINRRAELACSSEAADRDRVPCPAATVKPYRLRPGAFTANGTEYQQDGKWYRDIPVKATGPCLCDDWPVGSHAAGKHQQITRITLQDWHAERRIAKVLAEVNAVPAKGGGYLCKCGHACARWDKHCSKCGKADPVPAVDWQFTTAGDPRSYTLRVIPPSYAARNAGRDQSNLDSIGVPARESGIRW